MEERESVDVLFLGTISREDSTQSQQIEKSSCQDQIKFNDPVQIELIRIPPNGKELYSRFVSQTQKEQIKSLEIYYRNLDKKIARYSLLANSGNELLVSSSIDILVTLKQTIFTDLLVIRGNFTCISLCIYGRIIRSKQEIEKKCPYFLDNTEVPLREEQTSIKIHRNIFDESREMLKAIQDEYTEDEDDERKVYNEDGYSNDREIYDQQITNICKISQQLLVFDDLSHIDQRSIAQIRKNLQIMQSHLSKLFKSSRIGLFYPTPYRPSSIPAAIPVAIVKITTKLLSESLSDQSRSLEVLKLILQLKPHAQEFAKLGGTEALISLFLKFFSSDLVILSSLKLLVIQVLIVLSFWEFSAKIFVDKVPVQFQNPDRKSSFHRDSSQKQNMESPQKSKSKSRSRDKKKKKSQISISKSSQKDFKKSKKDKKDKRRKDKDRSRQKQREKQKQRKKDKKSIQKQRGKQKGKQKKGNEKQKQKINKQQKNQNQLKMQVQEYNLKSEIAECQSFYEMLLKIMRGEKNVKIQHLLRILVQQTTQTLTKNTDLSNQMALYTPLLRDTKYMFNQSGQMINSKTLKMFASFQPFLNEEQSRKVDSPYICESEKIKNPKKYGISPKLFKLIDSALTILQSKSLDEGPLILDQQFITLVSALIQNNKNGVAIGLNSFVDAIKIQSLLGLKKQEAVVAIICEYIHEILVEDEGLNLIYYLDQIHNSMLKIIGWLKEDRTFSLEIKRKVQFLINSALIYNHFSNAQNNFKSFSEYFTKLISHQNFDINKIVQYSKKQYHKSVNPLTFSNLSDNFSLGNFYDVMPAQPLLEVDICLRMFMVILKLNKNIWTVFYQFKFVPMFSTLYLKIYSLLKFFLSPSLERLNAILDIKIYERLICNYLQVLKHLISIFIHKWKYESAFNQLLEQQDIFDAVQLYEKWAETYLFIYYALNSLDSLVRSNKTKNKMKEVLANITELFDAVFKGYELTKNVDRQRNIKALIKFIYQQHFQSIMFRNSILSILRLFLSISAQNTIQVLVHELFQTIPKNSKQSFDILLPANQKSIFENILRKNMYRSDEGVIQNLAELMKELIKAEKGRKKIYQLIQTILDEFETQRKQQLEESNEKLFVVQKTTLFLNLLSFVKSPMNLRIQNLVLRILKSEILAQQQNQENQLKKLKLRNSCFNFFKTVITQNSQFSVPSFQQFVKIISPLIKIQKANQTGEKRSQQLKGILTIIESLSSACSNVVFQSVLLYGQYLEKPYKPACEFSLEKIFSYYRQNRHKQMCDQEEADLIRQIAIASMYLLCKLTSIDEFEFYSTQCRKNAMNALISLQKQFSLQQLITLMEDLVPKEFITVLKNYKDFPLIEKPQTILIKKQKPVQRKTIGMMFSKAVFTMISENDPVGRTRFQLIQDRWEGGDVQGELFKVNCPLDYASIINEKVIIKDIQIQTYLLKNPYCFVYEGIHSYREANNLFAFKIRKMSPLESKKNMTNLSSSIILKAIPSQIRKVQMISKETGYQNKLNISPQLNRNVNQNVQIQSNAANILPTGNLIRTGPIQTQPQSQSQQTIIRTGSNSNNRQTSPYNKTNIPAPNKPIYVNQQQPIYNPHPNFNQPIAPNNQTQIRSSQQPQYQPAMSTHIQRTYTPPIYDQSHMIVQQDPRSQYYQAPSRQYDPREAAGYPPTYGMVQQGSHSVYPPTVQGYGNPNMYRGGPVMQAPLNQQPRTQVTQPPPRSFEDEKAGEAISILMHLKQNPNLPDKEQLKAKVNRLLAIPGVHDRVTRWLQQMG